MKLSDEFYREEKRCGYTVSEKMKKIWAVELDMLIKVRDVCEKYNLSYFLDGGTLLGAVRHKGFIPWDDDIDVIMPRADYDKLWQISEKEFTYPYFFQTSLSEKNFFRTHAQIRNCMTTGFIKSDENKDICRGIFIDVFPLDNIPDSDAEKWFFQKCIKRCKDLLIYGIVNNFASLSLKQKFFYIVVKIFFVFVPYRKFFNFFNHRVMAGYSNRETKQRANISLFWNKRSWWDKSWHDEYVMMMFEGYEFRAPTHYDEILSALYGDYMTLPKDIMQGRTHDPVTFEPDVPYKKYFENKYGSRE